MPTVIDSLVLELGLDASKFTSVQKVAVNNLKQFEAQALRSGGRVESAVKTMFQAFSRAKVEILAFSAALLGAVGLKDLLVSVTSANAAADRLSSVLGVNVEELNKWQNMAKIAGGSAEGMSSTIASLVRDFAAFHTLGQQPEWNFWAKLDLSKFVDAKGDLKDVTGFLLAIAGAMEKMSPGDRMLFAQAFHIPTENMALFVKGKNTIQDMLKDQERLGVITKEMADNSRDLAENWQKTSVAAQFLANVVLNDMSKDMVKILTLTTELLTKLSHSGRLMAYLRDPVGAASTDLLNYLGINPTAAPIGKTIGAGALMSNAFTGGAGSPRPSVSSSSRVWGDKEAEAAGLYEPSGGVPMPRPRPSYASQMAGAGASAGRSSTSTINTSRTINFGGFTINAPNTDPKAIADQIVEQATRRFYAPSSQNGAR